MESDDDVPLILTWDEANSGLLNEETERDESKFMLSLFFHASSTAILELCYVCMSRPMAVDIAFGVAIIVAWYKQ